MGIYSLPSDLEGMPLSLLEAMSYGNCCLVSDIDECASVVEDKAIVFKVKSVDDTVKELNAKGIATEPVRLDDYTGKKMTFFHDPDNLPLEIHE